LHFHLRKVKEVVSYATVHLSVRKMRPPLRPDAEFFGQAFDALP